MNELIEILKDNLTMVFAFVLLLGLARTADICLGSAIAYKDIALSFDYHKILKSMVYSILAGIGVILVTITISLFPEFLKLYNIQIVDDDTMNMLTNITIIGIILTATIRRIKDCITKLQLLTKVKAEEIVQLQIVDGRD